MLFVPIFTLVPKLHPGLPETRFNLGTPEKNAKADPKVDMGSRSRSSSSTSTSPKPLLQSPKPSLAARPTIPQKPRTALRPGKGFSCQGVTPRTVASQGSWDGTPQMVSRAACECGLCRGSHEKPARGCGIDKSWKVLLFSSKATNSETVIEFSATSYRVRLEKQSCVILTHL